MIASINPTTGLLVRSFEFDSATALELRLSQANTAQKSWAKQDFETRADLLRKIAEQLRKEIDTYADLITIEMGKPLADSRAEIEKSALTCEFYAENGARFLENETIETQHLGSFVSYEPLGVIFALMPWNYPFWQVFRFLAPALMVGNGAILKHADNTPLCALAAQEIFEKAGGPEGLFSAIFVDVPAVQELINDPRIAGVTLTGSTRVGKIVGAHAAGSLKKQVLELGGSDPFVILKDADLSAAASAAVQARFSNSGQACINAKRFIVDQSVADEFVEIFVAETKKLLVGDPKNPSTKMGPMARADLRDNLHKQVLKTIEEGAALRLGGQAIEGDGFFYEPTILDHVTSEMTAFREETFGPLAAIIRAEDEEHAVMLANDSEYGLGASIWTKDDDRGLQLAKLIDAGSVFVNAIVTSDPRLPFGGIKQSGYGRELGSHGMHEFVNIKTTVLGKTSTN